jgi:hypothetical protein
MLCTNYGNSEKNRAQLDKNRARKMLQDYNKIIEFYNVPGGTSGQILVEAGNNIQLF